MMQNKSQSLFGAMSALYLFFDDSNLFTPERAEMVSQRKIGKKSLGNSRNQIGLGSDYDMHKDNSGRNKGSP